MALYVVNSREQFQWHTGEATSTIKKKAGASWDADSSLLVQADGDELDYIKSRFVNIPYCDNRVHVWKGEFARFIIDNI